MSAVTLRTAEPPVELAEAPTRTLEAFVDETGLESVVLGASKDPNAKVTTLLVSSATRRAVYAVKVPTTDVAERAVEAELRTLRALPRVGGIAPTLPEVVECVQHHGRIALVATALDGTPMTRVYLRRGHTSSSTHVRGDFDAAASWLAAFHDATAHGEGPIDFGGEIATRLGVRFADDPSILGDLARLDDILGRLGEQRVRRTAVHGDFWFGNLLVDDGRLVGVVDWEGAEANGDPVRDLVRFVVAYALYLDRGTRAGRRVRGHDGLIADEWGRPLEWALEGNGWFGDVFREFVRSGLTRLGASPDVWRDAILAGVAEVAGITDDIDFARHHLELFRRLPARPRNEGERAR